MVNDLVIDPLNPSIVYSGTEFQGVYRSADAGGSWTAVNNGLTDPRVLRLAIDPKTPSTLYAVTTAGLYDATGGKVFRTTNGGENWSPASNGLPTSSDGVYARRFSLVIDTAAPSTLYFSGGVGVYRSTNGADTWTRIDTGLPPGDDGAIYSLVIHPFVSSTLYAGAPGRVFCSTDSGATWAQVSTNLPSPAGRQALAIDPLVPTRLYYSGNEATFGGVWRSLDGGVTWTQRLGGPVGSLAVDPVTSSTVYAGTFFDGVWKSTDAGNTWARADTGMNPGGQTSAVAINPLVPARLYAATQGGAGVFRSDNAAVSWSEANHGLFLTTVQRLKAHPVMPATVYAMLADGTVMRSNDMGASWTLLPIAAFDLAIDPVTPSTIYAGTPMGVYRTTDGGTTWLPVSNGIPPSDNSFARALAIDPLTPSTVYAALYGGVYRSTNRGDSWTKASGGLPAGAIQTRLVIDPLTPSTLYLSGFLSVVYRTLNGGDSWTEVSNGLPTGEGVTDTALAINPVTPSTLYLATGSQVFRTTNAGATWSSASVGLPPAKVSSLVVDPVNPSTIYAATSEVFFGVPAPGAGVFKSTNGGMTWTPLNAGLADLSVRALEIDPLTPSILYAGTDFRGTFRWQPAGVRRLGVAKAGTGSGTVTSTTAGIQCGSDCVEEYPLGTVVTLNAVAQPPSTFVAFGGDPDCADASVTMSDNRTCTAIFNLPTYPLTVTKTGLGNGTVTSNPSGINCGTDCAASFPLGTVVTLTASPASDSTFGGWSGACTGSAQTCQVTMTQSYSVTAAFGVGPPGAFGKGFPGNGETVLGTLNVSLSWFVASHANTYEYCYDTTNDNSCSAWTSTGTATIAILSGLNFGTTYYWQVRATNGTGTTYANGSPTAYWSFTTGVRPGPFNKSSPSNGATGQPANLTLSWGASSGATRYEYCYDTTNDNNCTGWTSVAGATSAAVNGLSGGTTYYWQVLAQGASGLVTGANGGWWSFTVLAPASSDDLIVDFGTFGVWMLHQSAWTQLHTASARNIVTGDLDGNGIDDVIVDFGSAYGIWVWSNNSSWSQLHPSTASRMMTGDLDGNGKAEVLIDFPGFGIWVRSNNTSWFQLHASSASNMVAADLDGNGKQEAVIDFPGFGLWVWTNATSWSQLHASNSRLMTAGDIDGNGKADLIVDFAGYGLWGYSNNSAWAQVHTVSAAHLASGDVDGSGQTDVVIDFGSAYGIWMLRNGTAWSILHTLTSANILTADLDGNGTAEVVVSFGSAGLWRYVNNAGWIQLHAVSPGAIAAGHINAP